MSRDGCDVVSAESAVATADAHIFGDVELVGGNGPMLDMGCRFSKLNLSDGCGCISLGFITHETKATRTASAKFLHDLGTHNLPMWREVPWNSAKNVLDVLDVRVRSWQQIIETVSLYSIRAFQ